MRSNEVYSNDLDSINDCLHLDLVGGVVMDWLVGVSDPASCGVWYSLFKQTEMSCNITDGEPLSCVEFQPNNNTLKINWETMEVSIGEVTYGKLKGLIVANDKMEFTISLAENFKEEK